MPKIKWGLTGDPGEIEGNIYDGPTPPKGIYIVALKRLGVKVNKNGDPMLNGLLEIRDPRKGKKQFNGYSLWFNRNVNDSSARFVKNFIALGLGVPMKDLKALDSLVVLDDKDMPANVVSVGKVKIASEPLMVVAVKRRRQNDDPEGEWELVTDDFAPAFPGIDPKKLAAKASDEDDEDDEDEDDDEDAAGDDEDDETDDPFADDEGDEDESDDEDEDEDDDEDSEEELTEAELKAMGLEELRELAVEAGKLTKLKASKAKKTALVDLLKPADEDEDEGDEEEEEEPDEEPEVAPVVRKKRVKK